MVIGCIWPPNVKSWLIWKDSVAGKDWRQEEKGTTEDETVGWHHRLSGDVFESTLGVGYGQGGLVCCNSWGCKELDTTEWLNWIEQAVTLKFCSTCWKVGKMFSWEWMRFWMWIWSMKSREYTLRRWCYMEWKSHSLAGSDTVYLCGWYSHIIQ